MRGKTMRDKIGLFILEDDKGEVSIQLYADTEQLKAVFPNLVRLESNQAARATMLCLEFEGGEPKVTVESKSLPVESVPVEDRPDGIVLGKGPLFLPKEDEKEKEDGNKED
jgi:hypothetical protein